jgi:hypothetical protein
MIMKYILNIKVSDLEHINRVLEETSHIIFKLFGIVVFITVTLGIIYMFYYMIILGNLFSM